MDFGTFHLYSVPPWTDADQTVQDHFRQMVAADQLGFDEIWLAEHNGRTYGFSGNSTIVAASAASATKNIRIGTAVTRLPLHNALHLAEDLAFVDVLSGGRLDWGVGKGYDKHEFATYGVPFEEREERWQESFDAVRQIWATGRTGFSGTHCAFGDGEFLPAPKQGPMPPTYIMVSGSERSVVWAAERLLPIVIGSGPGWSDIREKLELYAETAERHGHARADVERTVAQTWQLRPVHVAPTTEQAVAEFERGLMWYMDSLANRAMFGFTHEQQDYEYFLSHGSVVVGSAEKVIDELGAYNERTGINRVICWINVGGQPHEQVVRALEQMSAQVIPELKDVTVDALARAS
jgi:alkanesulfonate monooxygenase SsuD/methylene tetrahydromethanopterin reductase-like flavin-dependent oxidoreductase (luciferase family)